MIEELSFEILTKDKLLAKVYVNIKTKEVKVQQFTHSRIWRQFRQDKITIKDISGWLESRCFPESRANAEKNLKALGLDAYFPLDIVRITHGLQYEDYIWVRFEGEDLVYNDIKIRD